MPIPSESPIQVPVLLCQGGCKSKMRVEPVYGSKGKVTKLVASCDQCKYSIDLSYIYGQGLPTKYIAPEPSQMNGAPPNGGTFVPPAPKPQNTRVPSPTTPQPVHADAEPHPEPENLAGLTGH